MNLQSEPPEKSSSSLPSPPPSFSLLPDEITENFLARVPRSFYPKLSLVSKTFRSILSSTDLYIARSRLGRIQNCLYVCLKCLDSSHNKYFQWITFSITPNRTNKKKKKNSIGRFSVLVPSSSISTRAKPTVVGSEIYVIGGYKSPSYSVWVLDCRTHTWRNAPSIIVPRQNPVSCVYDGKIYVLGGIGGVIEEESWGEVFNIKTQTWERLPQPGFAIDNIFFDNIAEIEGKIYFGNEHMCGYYDPKQCKWHKKGALLRWPQCVMDNVLYSFLIHGGRFNLWWSDINGGDRKLVKGLDSLGNRYERHSGSRSTTIKAGSCGGKFYLMWEGYTKKNNMRMVQIWCAEISLEKRDDEDEIWGNVEWFDVVHTAPTSCSFLHSLAISL